MQVAVTAPDGELPQDLSMTLVDPGESDADADVTSPATGAGARAAAPQLEYISRAEWGADESLRHDDPDYGDTIVAGFVHHTVTAPDYTPEESPGIVRSIYAYHTSNGWDDIGYNFLVDQYGQIFEGRYGGVDRPVVGGHTGGMNTDTFGVAALGNFEKREPTAVLLDAVEAVAAYKLDKYGRNPEGTVDYQAPDGTTTTIDVLSGHRDVKATLCPGEHLYPKLPVIRSATAARMAADGSSTDDADGADFDGDGYPDLVQRAPGEALGSVDNAGMVSVVPGSADGPVTRDAASFSQATAGVRGGPQTGDRFGWATAAGDFNGDSFADLAIGAPFEVLGSSRGVDQGHGAVHVLYGSSQGPTAQDDAWLTIDQAGASVDDGDAFGYALAAGDTNGDGYAELAVGAVGGGPSDSGAVVVYSGDSSGIATGSAALYHSGRGLPSDPMPSGDARDDVGAALAMGDTDGDGTDDLVIGAPNADYAEVEDSGAVFVVPGSGSGLDNAVGSTFTQATRGVSGSPERKDHFGGSLTLGRFDDAFGLDLAVGSGGEDLSRRPQAGMVAVLYSASAGLTGVDADAWHQGTAGVPGANEKGDRFGDPMLAAGDFDGNGSDDLAVSVSRENIGRTGNAGVAVVIRGGPGGLRSTGIRSWNQGSVGVPGVDESGDRFGSSLEPADVDGDGLSALLVGSQGENKDAGRTVLLRGSGSGPTSDGAEKISQNTRGMPGRGERGDLFGF